MSLETGSMIKDLVSSNPPGNDPASQGDDHIRLIKAVLKSQFAGFTEGIAITKTESEINSLMSSGAFGLGGFAIAITETAFAVADLPTGFYFVTADGSGFLPLNQSGFAINIDAEEVGTQMQFFYGGANNILYAHGKAAGVWTPWRTEWDSVNTPKQADNYDVTAGAILTPHSFGLGVTTSVASINCNLAPYALTTTNGRWHSGAWTNGPSGSASVGAILELITHPTNANLAQQRFTELNSQNEWTRHIIAGAFQPWQRAAKVVRELMASTGYQQIGNSLRQWGVTPSIADDGNYQVNFPYDFTSVYSVVVTPQAALTGTSFVCGGISSLNVNGFVLTNMSNSTSSIVYRWMAEGSGPT